MTDIYLKSDKDVAMTKSEGVSPTEQILYQICKYELILQVYVHVVLSLHACRI